MADAPKSYYDYHRLLELLEAERQKYKNDFMNSKDPERSRVAIIIVNAINDAERHCQEVIDVMGMSNG